MHIEERTLDVSKKDGRSGQIKPVILRKGEENQTQIKINLTSNGEPYSVGNLTPRFCAILPDKKYVRDASHVTKSTNYVTYTVQSDLTSADGDIRVAYIELQSSGNSLTSDNLPIIVLDNTDISQEKAEEYQSQIDALVKDLENSINKANNAASNASSAATSANNAASSANSAKTNAQNAANSANTAASAADNAAMAADKATSKANTAAEAANEAKQAVDEAMGKFTTVTDSEVKYQVGESGTTPPTGTWLTEPPTVPQGQYLWVRNTTSYNKRNPTVAYAVAFQGRDGSFAGNERIEELEKDIKNKQDKINFPGDPNKFLNGENEFIEVPFGELEDKVNNINDITTGINLVRGTRDFLKGTKLFGTSNLSYVDGFQTSHPWKFTKDELGYTVLVNEATATTTYNATVAADCSKPNVYTIFTDFMVSDNTKMGTGIIFALNLIASDGSQIPGTTTNINLFSNGYKKDEVVNGKWYKFVAYYTSPVNVDGAGIRLSLVSNEAGASDIWHFRKPGMYEGKINKPIWDASPLDVVTAQQFRFDGDAKSHQVTSGENYITYYTYTDDKRTNGFFFRYTKPTSSRQKQLLVGSVVNGAETVQYAVDLAAV